MRTCWTHVVTFLSAVNPWNFSWFVLDSVWLPQETDVVGCWSRSYALDICNLPVIWLLLGTMEVESRIDGALVPACNLVLLDIVLDNLVDMVWTVEGVHHVAVGHVVRQRAHIPVVVVVLLIDRLLLEPSIPANGIDLIFRVETFIHPNIPLFIWNLLAMLKDVLVHILIDDPHALRYAVWWRYQFILDTLTFWCTIIRLSIVWILLPSHILWHSEILLVDTVNWLKIGVEKEVALVDTWKLCLTLRLMPDLLDIVLPK